MHDAQEQKLFDAVRTVKLEQAGFLVIRVKERVVRDGIDHVVAWIGHVGERVMGEQAVSQQLRSLDAVPLP